MDAHAQSDKIGSAQVLVTGDLFRFVDSGLLLAPLWHQAPNMRWLSEVVRGAFATARPTTGEIINTEILDPSVLGASLNLPHGADYDTWWLNRLASPIDGPLAKELEQLVSGRVIIGFELPANLAELYRKHALALIEIRVSPLRFLDDLLLDARSSEPRIEAAIEHAALSDGEIAWAAGLARAAMRSLNIEQQTLPRNVALIAGQMPTDRSLIDGDRFATIADFADELAEIANHHPLLLLLPHPHGDGYVTGLAALRDIPNLKVITGNAYRMMASGRVGTLAALSSSLLREAAWFGVATHRLLLEDGWQDAQPIRLQSLGEGIADEVLALIGAIREPLPRSLPAGPALKSAIGIAWQTPEAPVDRLAVQGLDLASIRQGLYSITDPEIANALAASWHAIEAWGVWGRGSASIIALLWPDGRESPLRCTFDCISAPAADGSTPDISFWAEGRRLQAVVSKRPGAPTRFQLELSAPSVPGPVQIMIVTEASNPREQTSVASEQHRLGVGLVAFGWE